MTETKSGYAKALSGLVFAEVLRTASKANTVDDIVKRLVFRRKIVTGLGSKVPESVKKEALDVIDGTLKKLDPELYAKVRSGKFSIPADRIPRRYRKLYEAVLEGRTDVVEKILTKTKRHRLTVTERFFTVSYYGNGMPTGRYLTDYDIVQHENVALRKAVYVYKNEKYIALVRILFYHPNNSNSDAENDTIYVGVYVDVRKVDVNENENVLEAMVSKSIFTRSFFVPISGSGCGIAKLALDFVELFLAEATLVISELDGDENDEAGDEEE